MTLLSLFFSALVAATILPAQSEAVLAWRITQAPGQAALLVMVASLGNVLGAVVNWGLGRFARRFQSRRWFPASRAQMARAEQAYRRYGRFSLLASWVPFIGDPLTVIAGVLKEPLWSFVLIVSIAKTGRYIIVAAATLGLM